MTLDPLAIIILVLLVAGLVTIIVVTKNRSKRVEGHTVQTTAGAVDGGSTYLVTRTNGLAIASLVVVFFSSLIGLILGHVALAQIRRTGEGGRGLALAAVIIGWVGMGLVLVVALIIGIYVSNGSHF